MPGFITCWPRISGPNPRSWPEHLAEVAGWLEPAEAARVCAEPARLLKQALAEEKDSMARGQLAEGLVAVAGRMEPAEAVQLLSQALAQVKEDSPIEGMPGEPNRSVASWRG